MESKLKKLLSLLMVVFMVISMLPTTVFAATVTDDDGVTWEVVTTEDELRTALATTGANVKLGNDIALTGSEIKIDGIAVTLDLAGHSLTSTDYIRAFNLKNKATLKISNGNITMPGIQASSDSTDGVRGGIILLNNSKQSTLEMNNVTITKTAGTDDGTIEGGIITSRSGGIVKLTDCTLQWADNVTGNCSIGGNLYVANTNTVTLTRCTLSGGRAKNGGNIGIASGSLVTLEDCTVEDGYATSKGGNAYMAGATGKYYLDMKGTTSFAGGEAVDCGGSISLNKATSTYLRMYDRSTITGGKAPSGGAVYNIGNLEMYGGSITGGEARYGHAVYNTGTIVMNSGTISAGTDGGAAYDGKDTYGGAIYSAGGTITMNGGSVIGGTAKYGGAVTLHNASEMIVYDGTIVAGDATTGTAVYARDTNSSFKMYGGTVQADATNNWVFRIPGDSTENTIFNVYNGTLTGLDLDKMVYSSGTDHFSPLAECACANVTWDEETGLNTYTVWQYDPDETGKCETCGYTYGTNACTGEHTPGEAVQEDVVKATCTEDGSYNSVVRCTVCNSVITSTPQTIEATGHTYEVTTRPTESVEGLKTCACGTTESFLWDDCEASVEGYGYETLEEGIAAAVSGKTVVLLRNAELSSQYSFAEGDTVTVDLKGYNITTDGTRIFHINNANVSVTLTDSTAYYDAEGNYVSGYIQGANTDTGGSTVYLRGTGSKFILNGGTVKAPEGDDTPTYGGGAFHASTGELIINGGTITGGDSSTYAGALRISSATVTINGGKFVAATKLPAPTNSAGKSDKNSHGAFALMEKEAGTLNIYGGDFTHSNTDLCFIYLYENGTVNIYNGTFNIDPSACVVTKDGTEYDPVADCACVTENTDGTYTVWQYALDEADYCKTCEHTYTNACEGEHSWDNGVAEPDATCTAAGSMKYTCTVCGEPKTETIEASGHDLSKTDAVAEGCETAGNSAYWTCSDCDKYFSDDKGETEIAEGSWVIEATDHDWSDWDSNEDGTHSRVCANNADHTDEGTCNTENNGACSECGYVAKTYVVFIDVDMDGVMDEGEVGYETLQDAIDAMPTNASEPTAAISLLDDVELTEYVKVTGSRVVVINTNGYSITGNVGGVYGMLYVGVNSTLAIVDATESGDSQITNNGGIAVGNYGQFAIAQAELTGSTAALYNFYYNGSTYGGAYVQGGTKVGIIWNSGYLHLQDDATAEYIDNSGYLTILGNATVTELYMKNGSHAEEVPNCGTVSGIANVNKVIYDKDNYDLVEGENGSYLQAKNFVAKIGDKGYETLEAAIEAAAAGDTIELLDDVTSDAVVLINKDITLNGNGNTITSSANRVIRLAASVTINDLNVVSTAVRSGTNDIRGISVDSVSGKTIELNNCSVDFTDASATDWSYGVNQSGTASSGNTITINGGTYEGANVINIWGEGHTVVVDGATLNCIYGVNDYYHGQCVMDNSNSSTMTVKNCTLNGSHATAFGEGNAVTAEDNTDNTKQYVAKVGSTYYYSLEEAVAAAAEGETVKLINNVELTSRLSVSGTVTLDLNGYEITGEFYDQFGVIYVKKGANLTVKDSAGDGKITGTDSVLIGNYGTVTVEGGTLTTGVHSEYGQQPAVYNFYYKADYYGTATIAGGTMASPVYNCGELTVSGGELALVDNSGALTVEGGEIAQIYGRDGSDAAGVTGAGTIAIEDTSAVTVPDGYALAETETAGVYKVVEKNYVVAIGDDKYESLDEALEAAKAAGMTEVEVTVLADVEWSEKIGQFEKITFNGTDRAQTFTLPNKAVKINTELVFNDLTVSRLDAEWLGHYFYILGGLSFNDCKMIGLYIVTAQDTDFIGCDFYNDDSFGNGNYSLWLYNCADGVEVNVTGCTFDVYERAIKLYGDGLANDAVLNVTDTEFTSRTADKTVVEIAYSHKNTGSGSYELNFSNVEYNNFGTYEHTGNDSYNTLFNVEVQDGGVASATTVTLDSETIWPIAVDVARNETTGVTYTSLEEAFANAEKGDTITLLDNVTLTKQLLIKDNDLLSDVTLDGDGYTIYDAVSGASTICFGADGYWATGVKLVDVTVKAADGNEDPYCAIRLYGGTSSVLTNVDVIGDYTYGVNFYGTHGATLTDCNIDSAWINGQSAYPLNLVNSTIGTAWANSGENSDPKVFLDADSSIETLYAYQSTEMIDPSSLQNIGTVLEMDTELPMVAKTSNGTLYSTLEIALNAAQDGDTVTLIADVELETSASNGAFQIEAGRKLTLDLNGYDITAGAREGYTNRTQYAFDNYADLTITGEGTITSRGIQNYGTLTIDSADVTVIACDTNGGAAVYAYADSVTNISAGTYKTNGGAASVIYTFGELYITGGSFTQKDADHDNYAYAIQMYGDKAELSNAVVTGSHGALNVGNGSVVVNSGTYSINGVANMTDHCVYVADGADLTVYGGSFAGDGETSTGGRVMSVAGTAVVTGGTFSEDVDAYCAEGYTSLEDMNGNYVVGTEPTATINNLGSMTVEGGSYYIYGSGDGSKDMPLNFVMQYVADQDAEDMKTSPYKKWYADFVLTFTGLENGSFIADEETYLAGYYGETEYWSGDWVKVPITGMEVTNGTRYPVMMSVGMPQDYNYICAGVQEFLCAMNISKEILDANPNLKVTLELNLVDNSAGDTAALNALVANEGVTNIASIDFYVRDFLPDVASVTDADGNVTNYKSLEDAIEAAEAGDTVTLLDNIELDAAITVEAGKNVTIDLNGKTVSYTSNVVGEDMITNYGTLTINDSVGGGKITYNNTDTTGSNVTVSTITNAPGGLLNVNAGTIENTTSDAKAWQDKGIYSFAIDNVTNGTLGTARTNINGGTIKSTYRSVRLFANSTDKRNSVYIYGGELIGQVWLQAANSNAQKVTLFIQGGTFAPVGNDASSVYVTTLNSTTPTFRVTGGYFNTKIGTDNAALACNYGIAGGTFTAAAKENTSEALVRSGYEFVQNEDGTYGVETIKIISVTDTEGNVTKYASVDDAAKALTDGCTVTLLQDVAKGFTVSGMDVTLELNGYEMKTSGAAIFVESGASLTVQDSSEAQTGKITASNDAITVENGSLTVKSGTIETTGDVNTVISASYADITIEGGRLISANNGVEMMYNSESAPNTFTMTGGEIDAVGYGVTGNGTYDYSTVSVTGGTINGDEIGIYHPQGGTMTISSGTISGGTGVYVKGGNVTISGNAVINGTGVKAAPDVDVNTDGTTSTGDALVVHNEGETTAYGKITITVDGGTFTSANTEAVASYATGEEPIITGFIPSTSAAAFSTDASAYCDPGYETTAQGEDGLYRVSMIEGIVAWNMQTGKIYTTVAEALAEAAKGETVQMLADSTEDQFYLIIGADVTLDINGKTLTVNNYLMTVTATSYIIDSTNGDGLLKIAKANLIVAADYTEDGVASLPIWIKEDAGYRMTTVTYVAKAVDNGSGSVQVRFYPNDETAELLASELADGTADDDGLTVMIRVTYTNAAGVRNNVELYFQESTLSEYGAAWNVSFLWMNISGLEGLSDIVFEVVTACGDIELASEQFTYTPAES